MRKLFAFSAVAVFLLMLTACSGSRSRGVGCPANPMNYRVR